MQKKKKRRGISVTAVVCDGSFEPGSVEKAERRNSINPNVFRMFLLCLYSVPSDVNVSKKNKNKKKKKRKQNTNPRLMCFFPKLVFSLFFFSSNEQALL